MKKGSIDMVSFIIGFGVMIILIVAGSYFMVGDATAEAQAEVTAGGTNVQTFYAANSIFKSEKINIQEQMENYRDPNVNNEDITKQVNSSVNDFLNSSYDRYEFRIEGTNIELEENRPTGIYRFYISTPSGEEQASLMVDNQKGEPYEPVIGASSG